MDPRNEKQWRGGTSLGEKDGTLTTSAQSAQGASCSDLSQLAGQNLLDFLLVYLPCIVRITFFDLCMET